MDAFAFIDIRGSFIPKRKIMEVTLTIIYNNLHNFVKGERGSQIFLVIF